MPTTQARPLNPTNMVIVTLRDPDRDRYFYILEGQRYNEDPDTAGRTGRLHEAIWIDVIRHILMPAFDGGHDDDFRDTMERATRELQAGADWRATLPITDALNDMDYELDFAISRFIGLYQDGVQRSMVTR